MVSGHDPTMPSDGAPDYLPDEPSASMRPPPSSDSETWSDPQLRLRAMLDKDFEESLSGIRSDPSAYLLRREVGHGTFGEVLEAVQVALHRVVAVKRPRAPETATESEHVEQSRIADLLFHKEALTTSHLDHPNIVPVYDLGIDSTGRPLLAMKLVEGVAWNQKLRADAALPAIERLARHIPILLLASRAVAFAHARGIVHRDLKPSQVMVGNFGEVFLMDWGSAIAMPDAELMPGMPADNFATPREIAPNPAGTVAYMAPEQTLRSPDQLGPWTDVYLLGGILYEILSGQCPHPQERSADAFMHAARGMVEFPDKLEQQLPVDLSALCLWALAPRINERMQTATEFVAALEAWLSGTNLREQSRTLTAEAAAVVQKGSTGYSELEQADSLLVRALNAWSENQEAQQLRQQVLTRFVHSALAEGDLKLAGAQSERIQDFNTRTELQHVVNKAQRRMARHQKQRRFALVASLLLLVGISALALVTRSNAEADRVLESKLAEERLQSEMKSAESQRIEEQQTIRAKQLGRLNQLRDTSTAFINRVSRTVPLPDHLENNHDWSWNFLVSQNELANTMRKTLQNIAELRAQCESDGFTLTPPRYELFMAAATLSMEDDSPSRSLVDAYHKFALAAASSPHRFEPHFCMAIAAARAGNMTSATAALDQAIPRVSTGQANFDALFELRRRFITMAAKHFQPAADDIIVEAWRDGINHERFQPVTDNWLDTARQSGFKSAAPGLSANEHSGSQSFMLYEPFAKPQKQPPAVARFIPNPSARRHFHVYTTWPSRANAMPVRYSIRHADGETSIALAQDGWAQLGLPNGNLWISLGEFDFLPGVANFVQLTVDSDARPITPQRHGEAIADACYFATKPLDQATTVPLLVTTQDFAATNTLTATAASTQTLQFMQDLSEARDRAKKEQRSLMLFVYYPTSSVFTHPINRYRDYCENRLFTDPKLIGIIQQFSVPVAIDLSKHPEAATALGVNPAEVSLCVCKPDGTLHNKLTGEGLMLPPVQLQSMLRDAAAAP